MCYCHIHTHAQDLQGLSLSCLQCAVFLVYRTVLKQLVKQWHPLTPRPPAEHISLQLGLHGSEPAVTPLLQKGCSYFTVTGSKLPRGACMCTVNIQRDKHTQVRGLNISLKDEENSRRKSENTTLGDGLTHPLSGWCETHHDFLTCLYINNEQGFTCR